MAVIETGAIFKTLRFDGTSLGTSGVLSSDYGVYITGEAVYNAPERDVNMITIPGRNGTFAQDNGRFNNITVTYPAGLIQQTDTDFKQAISDFRNALCSRTGYRRLEDDYHTDEYRMAVYKNGLEVTPANLEAGEFSITFECKPQRFLKSGETWTTATQGLTFSNPTLFEAAPLLEVKGYGTIKLTQGDYAVKDIVVDQSADNRALYIDCETGFSYYQEPAHKESAGSRVTLPTDLPRFTATGNNRFTTIPNTITSFKVQPRWWKI